MRKFRTDLASFIVPKLWLTKKLKSSTHFCHQLKQTQIFRTHGTVNACISLIILNWPVQLGLWVRRLVNSVLSSWRSDHTLFTMKSIFSDFRRRLNFPLLLLFCIRPGFFFRFRCNLTKLRPTSHKMATGQLPCKIDTKA